MYGLMAKNMKKFTHVQKALLADIENYNKEMKWDNYLDHKAEPHILEESIAYLDDKDFMLEAIKIDPFCLKFASERLKNDKTIVKATLKSERFVDYVFKFIGEDLKKNEKFKQEIRNKAQKN